MEKSSPNLAGAEPIIDLALFAISARLEKLPRQGT
jgi:hypothetical protein